MSDKDPPRPHLEYDLLSWGDWGGDQGEYFNGQFVDVYTDILSAGLPRPVVGDDYLGDMERMCRVVLDSAELCEFCGYGMGSVEAEIEEALPEWGNSSGQLRWCENCKAWLWFSFVQFPNEHKGFCWHYARSKARSFDATIPPACDAEIAQWFRRYPEYFHQIDPTRLEKFIARVYAASYTKAEVLHVGRSGDGGVDVLFVDADGSQCLIQVKRRSRPGAVEPYSTVQSLAGTLLLRGALKGVVVTTADRFSLFAQQAARKLRKYRYSIDLVDKGKLNRMISPVLPRSPWRPMVGYEKRELGRRIAEQIRQFRRSHRTQSFDQLKDQRLKRRRRRAG